MDASKKQKAILAFLIIFILSVAVAFVVLISTSPVTATDKLLGFSALTLSAWLITNFSLGKDLFLGYVVTEADSEYYSLLRYLYLGVAIIILFQGFGFLLP